MSTRDNKKKLIEVALPLEAINAASVREKSIRHGHPSTLHLWWSRKPTATARAVLFAQMVDDPSEHPDLFPTIKAQQKERERLFRIIEKLVVWENTTDESIVQSARDEIWQSWRQACAQEAGNPGADELFDRHRLPSFYDPFAGGGTIPLEAQRLGLRSYASDLNPVAVLITKAMIEIPPKFGGWSPVNPEARAKIDLAGRNWHGAEGLAEDVRYYGDWVRDRAEKKIGHLYPKVDVTAAMMKGRPDLKPYLGKKLTAIAWIWARTVKSPNPAFAKFDIPLASSFMLSSQAGKEVYVDPVVEGNHYSFTVKVGRPKDLDAVKSGTRQARGSFRCLFSGVPVGYEYIDDEANNGRMGARLMAVVAQGEGKRIYLPPSDEMETAALSARPTWKPDVPSRGTWASNAQGRRYGFATFGDYFTSRQLVALTTFSDLISEVHAQIVRDSIASGKSDDHKSLEAGGQEATAYADALAVYLAFAVDRMANTLCTIARWTSDRQQTVTAFAQQGIAMSWGYPEVNPFAGAAGDYAVSVEGVIKGIPDAGANVGSAYQADALVQSGHRNKIVSTDPPYYDNVGYADLADFFYVWLRRSLKSIIPSLFATVAVPKAEELIASPYRHGTKAKAEQFFMNGMTRALKALATQAHPGFPITIYYAFKQSETDSDKGTVSTGWETFLDAVILAGFAISGTWPIRTELYNRKAGMGTNALASSIVLVCRPHTSDAPPTTRREFASALKAELPAAVKDLQRGNIAPVDLAQAAIGPGMAIYTRYSKVLDAEGKPLSVRDALGLINQTLDEALAEQEGDFDADSRWALAWFEHAGFADGDYGVAETLSKAKNTSVGGLAEAGLVVASRGKVRLLRPIELSDDWDPRTDSRLTSWEVVHHLIRVLEARGESVAADLVATLGARAELARELAYRLYALCERKKRAVEALSYNGLVQSWPEMLRLAREGARPADPQVPLFQDE